MMRRLIPVFLCAGLLSLATLATAAGQPRLASLRLGDSPYEMARPALWRQGPIQGDAVVTSWVASDTYLYPNLNVTLEALQEPGEAGVNAFYEKLTKSLPGFKPLQEGWVEFGGIRGHRSVSRWTSIFGELAATRMLIPWEEKVFVVTFVDLAQDFAQNAALYDLCLSALAPFKSVEAPKEIPGNR